MIQSSAEIPASAVVQFPEKLSLEALLPVAYRTMVRSRRIEARLLELFQKGYVKGTVTQSNGNEATAVGMALPLRPGRDIVSFLHRDFASHLLFGATPYQLVCQYMANADSLTHGREGNCHHGDARNRRLPMMSHLGKMLSLVVGGAWAARCSGEKVFGLAVVGDGGSSTGEFHEALNIASVRRSPVLFVVQNNGLSFSTPTSAQYRCENLSDRAAGYGITGRTIDGTDVWEVYTAVWDALAAMAEDPAPAILECRTVRLVGHAAYDKADYVSDEQMAQWQQRDPLPKTRARLLEACSVSEDEVAAWEQEIEEEVSEVIARAVPVARPDPVVRRGDVYASSSPAPVKPFQAKRLKNGEAVNRALDSILTDHPRAFLVGLDVGTYGSAFKTCKGLIDRHGPQRVVDMPLCESGLVGFCLGASQVGGLPIMEFQFADFSTEAVTQLGLNAGTWHFRSGCDAPLLMRLPCGGGLTMGAFHSGEYEGLWGRFPGLKLLYPATAQETYEALIAGFADRNPCLVFEHKLLYWSKSGPVDFDGDVRSVWRSRRYTEGEDVTIVATGAMVHEATAAAARSKYSVEVWNPFVLQPLDLDPIIDSVEKTSRLLVVQECGESGGLGNRIISQVLRHGRATLKCPAQLLAAPDLPVPFAPELETYCRPNADKILATVERMIGER
ncbi:MAG: transketolase [Planctomycetes bacterium]|nr:transketolase [Planctomycetota bacterium]